MNKLEQPGKHPAPDYPKPPPHLKHRKSGMLWKVVMEEVFDDLLRFIFLMPTRFIRWKKVWKKAAQKVSQKASQKAAWRQKPK